MKDAHICEKCSTKFVPEGTNPGRYCSMRCYAASRRLGAKICEHCGAVFHSDSATRRFCSRQCYRQFRRATPVELRRERARQKRREWTTANREKLRVQANTEAAKARRKAWELANPEKVAECKRRSREKMAQRRRDQDQKYLLSEKGRLAQERHRLKFWRDPSMRMLRIMKAAALRAKAKGIAFDLELQQKFVGNPPMSCSCCGVRFNYNEEPSRTRRRNSPSIDKVDNNGGYTLDNVQIICWGCNEDKNSLTAERLEQLAAYVRRFSPAAQLLEVA